MKSDIDFPAVTDVKMAIARSHNDKGESDWHVYVINNKPVKIHNLMIVSKAFEKEGGGGRSTSTLRHYIENLEAGDQSKVERMDPAVFSFYNEFWVSFYIGRSVFDKKFLIAPFAEWEVSEIPELNLSGVVSGS
ncbi:MAG: hypothetical protein U5L96_22205 [Owenweeksia sp.]|nr:hypothetical protein [Owenweeksia sp.]